ncbi:MAG: hypothetical protein AB8I08_40865 [Sandaracinaceae bacterium]
MAHPDVPRVISAVPRPGSASQAKLRALPVEALLEVLGDRKYPWWRRRPAAEALRGRIQRRA